MSRIELVLVLLFTFFVIVVWVTSDVILVKPNTPDDPKIQTMLEPLTPTFDQETLDNINKRQLSTPIRPNPRPTIVPTIVPQSSASPQPSPSVITPASAALFPSATPSSSSEESGLSASPTPEPISAP